VVVMSAMRVLVLGGTTFLGPAILDAALDRGDQVTIFHRGRQPSHRPGEVEEVLGDRDGGLDPLAGRQWDVCFDTSGYVPRVVRDSAEFLAGAVERYVFVSSESAYSDLSAGLDESRPVHKPPPDGVEGPILEHYGPLKVGCERAVEAALPGRAIILRAGLLVGPRDPLNRFAYWVTRVAEGGEVLAPGGPEQPVQILDVRDLAPWALTAAAEGRQGIVNAIGERGLSLGGLLDTCRTVSSSDARVTWVDEDFLEQHEVEPWDGLPLWLPSRLSLTGMLDGDDGRAREWGLTTRPVAETVRDVLAFERSRTQGAPGVSAGMKLEAAGISREKERQVLAAWHARSGSGR